MTTFFRAKIPAGVIFKRIEGASDRNGSEITESTLNRGVKMTTSKATVVGGSRRVALPGAKALGPANQHAVIDVLVKVRRKKDIGKIEARPKTAMSRDAVGSS